MIDIHIHILPGLDDGAEDMAEALAMCRQALDDGVTRVVATPHMLDGVYDVSPERARDALGRLRERLSSEGMDLAVEIGADVHIAKDLPERLARGEALTISEMGKYLMVELPQDVWLPGAHEVLFELQLAGVTPILSHPERNLAVQDDPDVLIPLVEAENLVQVTAESLTGGFGSRPQRCARELVERHLAHLVASDAHSATRRKPGLSRARSVVEDILPLDESQDMFVGRPTSVLAGEEVSLPEPVRGRSAGGWLGRLLGRRAW